MYLYMREILYESYYMGKNVGFILNGCIVWKKRRVRLISFLVQCGKK